MRAQIIAFANQKGGVGKTTSCINLGASLAATQRRILLVDFDPQGNATMGSGLDKHQLSLSAYEVVMDEAPAREVISSCPNTGYDIIPANSDLTAAEIELLSSPEREKKLAKALSSLSSQYHYILIDCPPSLNMLTVNALVAADSVLIPMQCEYFALEGLTGLLSTIAEIKKIYNPKLAIQGILRTMFDPRNRLAVEVARQLIEHFGDKVYRTVIPRNTRLAEAPSHGLPAIQYDRYSRGSIGYLTLAGEILRREEQGEELVCRVDFAPAASGPP
ncbi:MAG: ParA family protein [Gammaproteobacteria bacterium]|nr:ParA family protein [Gammaproteobacteria bacterium]